MERPPEPGVGAGFVECRLARVEAEHVGEERAVDRPAVARLVGEGIEESLCNILCGIGLQKWRAGEDGPDEREKMIGPIVGLHRKQSRPEPALPFMRLGVIGVSLVGWISMEDRRDRAGVHRRRCPCCGHDGRELQGRRGRMVFRCPGCGADLYARPARSYAEMEGLAVGPPESRGWLRGLLVVMAGWVGLSPSQNPIEPRQIERVGQTVHPRSPGSADSETRSSDVLG